MSATYPDRRGLVAGAAAGVVAWLFGYAFTYLIVAPDLRESSLNRILEALQGEPATVDMVGWVFYNAHLVETVVADVPLIGTSATSFVGGDGGFTPLLYVIPVALLIAAGLAAGRRQGVDTTTDGVVAGLAVLPGYLLASLVGAFVFVVSVGSATVSPDLVTAILVAGIAYPVLFGGAGGVLAALTASR